GRRRYDNDGAVTIGRLHGVAGNLQRIGVLVINRGERNLVPALAGRKTAVIEIAAAAGLPEADQRDGARRHPAAVADELHEGVDRRIGRGKRFCHRLGRGPALAAFRGDALGFVEGGGIESRLLRESGGREPGASGEPVEGVPDLRVSQHGVCPLTQAGGRCGIFIRIVGIITGIGSRLATNARTINSILYLSASLSRMGRKTWMPASARSTLGQNLPRS